MVHCGGPGIQFTPWKTHQAAGCIEPKETSVVFPEPVNRIAWQSILSGHGCNTSVLQPAEPTLGRNPERTVLFKSKVSYTGSGQTLRDRKSVVEGTRGK